MPIIIKRINLSVQRPVKIAEYMYPKIELGMLAEIQDEQPRDVIDNLYSYLDAQVDRLLELEATKADRNRQTVADKLPFLTKKE